MDRKGNMPKLFSTAMRPLNYSQRVLEHICIGKIKYLLFDLKLFFKNMIYYFYVFFILKFLVDLLFYLRGALKYYIKAYDLAILDLTKATTIDTQCPLPYFNRAVCYHENGQHEKALTDYSIVLLLADMLELKVHRFYVSLAFVRGKVVLLV